MKKDLLKHGNLSGLPGANSSAMQVICHMAIGDQRCAFPLKTGVHPTIGTPYGEIQTEIGRNALLVSFLGSHGSALCNSPKLSLLSSRSPL